MSTTTTTSTQKSFEELLSLIGEPRSNVQLEALKAFLTIIQSNPLHFVNLIEKQHKSTITTLVSLIQNKEEKLVRLALTCLIAITAASHTPKTPTSAHEEKLGTNSKILIDDLEQKAHEGTVKLMLLDKIVDKLMNLLIVYDNKLRMVNEKMKRDNTAELGHERYKIDSMMELICILLANITTIEHGVSRFLQMKSFNDAMDEIKKSALDSDDEEEDSDEDSDDEDWAQGYHFKKLMDMFLAQKPVYVPWELEDSLKSTRWIANIFTNLSTVPSGRMLFLKEKEQDNDTNFTEKTGVRLALQLLFPYIRDEDVIKRRGVLSTIRNCLFFKEKHFLLRQTPLLNILLNRFSNSEVETHNQLSDNTIPSDSKFKFKEVEPMLRRTLSDCLVMMTVTLAGMDQMSTESVYKMLEQELKETDDQKVKSNIETIIQRLNNRLAKKNNMDDGGQMVRMEYIDDDEEEEGEEANNEKNAPEELSADQNEVNDLD